MDLADQMAAVWARRRLLLTIGVAAALCVFVWRSALPETYRSTATVQVQPPSPVSSDTATQVEFYADTVVGLVMSRDVVSAALDAVGRQDDPAVVAEQITAESGTQPGFVDVSVEDDAPREAAALVDALVAAVAERVTADQTAERDLLSGVLASIEQARDALPDGDQAARAALDGVQTSLESALESGTPGAIWQVTTVADAEVPTAPASPVPARDALLALLVALILAGEGIVIRRAWRGALSARDPARDVGGLLGVPAVAVAPDAGPGALTPLLASVAHADRVTVIEQGRRPQAQTATLLAELLAGRGRKVLLVDANPVRPSVHHEVDVPVAPGLTDLSSGQRPGQLEPFWVPHLVGVRVLPAGRADALAQRPSESLAQLAAADVGVLVVAVSVARASDVATVLAESDPGVVMLGVHGDLSRRELREDTAALSGLGLDPAAVVVRTGSSSVAARRSARRRRGVESGPTAEGDS